MKTERSGRQIKSTLPGRSGKRNRYAEDHQRKQTSPEENAELRKAIEETLRELNDAGFANKIFLIMSASIRLERALEKVTEDES